MADGAPAPDGGVATLAADLPIDGEPPAVRLRMAQLLSRRLGLPMAGLLSGAAFEQIDPAFDSLHLIEAVLLVESEFGVELGVPWSARPGSGDADWPDHGAGLDTLVGCVTRRAAHGVAAR